MKEALFPPEVLRKQVVLKLANAPLVSEDCVAYHGTSLETITHLIEKGSIPGYTGEPYIEEALPQLGDMYFTPFDGFTDTEEACHLDVWLHSLETALSESIGSAETNAQGHRIARFLGLPISKYSAHGVNLIFGGNSLNIDYQNALAAFAAKRVSKERIWDVIEAARRRRGFLLGLHRKALKDFRITEGDGGDDIRVCTGNNGLGPEYLTTIKPLGPEEEEFLNSLR